MCLFGCKIYHPNINARGQICLSILKPKTAENEAGWSAALKIETVLLSIQVLMQAPNLEDPLDEEVCAHWKANEEEAKQKAREWTE